MIKNSIFFNEKLKKYDVLFPHFLLIDMTNRKYAHMKSEGMYRL